MVIAIGVVLSAAGLVLLFNVGGAGDMVIKRVTSQSLGDLAPGFASTKRGFNIYATLILAVGVFALGRGVAGSYVPIGTSLMVRVVITWCVASVRAIAGDIVTFYATQLKCA